MGEGSYSKIKVVFIGSGNVATHLAGSIAHKADILQIYSKDIANAKALACSIGVNNYTDRIENIDKNADVYIISIKDDVIENIANHIAKINSKALWLHTSGSKTMEIFKDKAANYGVLYPLQTFTKGVNLSVSEIPFFVEGDRSETLEKIKVIASLFSVHIYEANSEKRRRMHIAAVYACNFANHLWTIADEILKESELPFEILLPLINASVEKIGRVTPFEAQTGPASRGDLGIISNHLALLQGDKKEIYKILSDSILKYHNECN